MTDKTITPGKEYVYEEKWTWSDEESGQGTLSLTEKSPDQGQSKNNVRTIEYDCTPEDLVAGLEKLRKKLSNSIKTYDDFVQKQEDKKAYAKSQGYSLQIDDEMLRILTILDHHKTITDLDSLQTTLTEAAAQVHEDETRVHAREETLRQIQGE